jgi:hypothetical protein
VAMKPYDARNYRSFPVPEPGALRSYQIPRGDKQEPGAGEPGREDLFSQPQPPLPTPATPPQESLQFRHSTKSNVRVHTSESQPLKSGPAAGDRVRRRPGGLVTVFGESYKSVWPPLPLGSTRATNRADGRSLSNTLQSLDQPRKAWDPQGASKATAGRLIDGSTVEPLETTTDLRSLRHVVGGPS